MDNARSIFEELLTSNSLYNKSIETLDSNTSIDSTIFLQLENCLSKLTIKDEESDYLSPLLLFLLEHIPLEIDLHLLTSIQTDYQHQPSTNKFYKPNLFVFIQYSSESQRILNQLFRYFQINNLKEFLQLKQISHHCLHLLTPLLLKTTYDKYPIAIQLFVQIIQSMTQSSISETFDLIFPVCLITLDDPSIDMKLLSLYLLNHLQRNSTITDLLLFNRANVVM